jgi:hypothetical protein
MKRSMLSTNIAIFLSINVQVEKDGQTWFVSRRLVSLTWILAQWLLCKKTTHQCCQSIREYLTNLGEQLLVASTMLDIGYRSVLYGLGVSL